MKNKEKKIQSKTEMTFVSVVNLINSLARFQFVKWREKSRKILLKRQYGQYGGRELFMEIE